MARVKNVVEKAESMLGKIPERYTLSCGQMIELYEKSGDWFHIITNSFRFGYMQGVKATKAEASRGGGCVNGR